MLEPPIRFESGVATPFDPFLDPDVWPRPVATSADGSIVVGLYDDDDVGDPYRGVWRHESGGYATLDPGNVVHLALAVSPDGAIAGGAGDLLPLLWDASGEIELPRRFDLGAWVSGVIDGGAFAVGTECLQVAECAEINGIPGPGPVYEAVVWIDGEIASLAEHLTAAGLDVSAWHFDYVDDLGPDGRTLVGSVRGSNTGWLARDVPVPEPGAPLRLAAGAALLAAARARAKAR